MKPQDRAKLVTVLFATKKGAVQTVVKERRLIGSRGNITDIYGYKIKFAAYLIK